MPAKTVAVAAAGVAREMMRPGYRADPLRRMVLDKRFQDYVKAVVRAGLLPAAVYEQEPRLRTAEFISGPSITLIVPGPRVVARVLRADIGNWLRTRHHNFVVPNRGSFRLPQAPLKRAFSAGALNVLFNKESVFSALPVDIKKLVWARKFNGY